MTVCPIIFSAPMVRAILEGRKTQTRRLAWQEPRVFIQTDDEPPEPILVPTVWQKAGPGDLLWVRETWAESAPGPVYKADVRGADTDGWGWRPSIHMPRWASRITLEVTAVRLQRLQEIVADDAIAEGIDSVADNFGNGPAYCDYELPRLYDTAEWFASPIDSFASLWRSIHGPGAWEENPEVVAIGFRPHLCNIDEWSKAT